MIVDYLWLKVNMMKEEGQFYEVMSDAELITQLQRFARSGASTATTWPTTSP